MNFTELTPEELRQIAKRGGIASGEARRERAKLKTELTVLLSDGDIQSKICTSLISKALSGDVRAFEVIRDTLGEKAPTELTIDARNDLDAFREEYRNEIILLVYDEWTRKYNDEPPRYNGLSHALCTLEMKEEAVRRVIEEVVSV